MTSTTPYSAFFSSGLLAPPLHISTTSLGQNQGPASPNSPISACDDVDEIEKMSGVAFPTPNSNFKLGLPPVEGLQAAPTSPRPPNTPRLRRRRSSITMNMSVVGTIKSPTRAASNAFAWERVLARTTPSQSALFMDDSQGRGRSGSLGQIDMNVGVSVDQRDKSVLNRRHRRRYTLSSRSGPTSAPPEAPLPPLPSFVLPPSQPAMGMTRPKLQLSLSVPSIPHLTVNSAPPTHAGFGFASRGGGGDMEVYEEGNSYEDEEMEPPTSPLLGADS